MNWRVIVAAAVLAAVPAVVSATPSQPALRPLAGEYQSFQPPRAAAQAIIVDGIRFVPSRSAAFGGRVLWLAAPEDALLDAVLGLFTEQLRFGTATKPPISNEPMQPAATMDHMKLQSGAIGGARPPRFPLH